jgi:hypothetical protein
MVFSTFLKAGPAGGKQPDDRSKAWSGPATAKVVMRKHQLGSGDEW